GWGAGAGNRAGGVPVVERPGERDHTDPAYHAGSLSRCGQRAGIARTDGHVTCDGAVRGDQLAGRRPAHPGAPTLIKPGIASGASLRPDESCSNVTRTGKPFGNYAASHDQTCIEPGQRLDHLGLNRVSERLQRLTREVTFAGV